MKKLTKEFAEILGLLCSEGCHVLSYSTYIENYRGKKRLRKNKKSERIEFYNKDLKLLKHYCTLLKTSFNYDAKITKNNKINIGTKAIIEEILKHTSLGVKNWAVPKNLKTASKEVKLAFVRGYFDGDGSASNNIRFFSSNKAGIVAVRIILAELGFRFTLQGPILKKGRIPSYVLQLTRPQRETFLNKIKPISKVPAQTTSCGGIPLVSSKGSLEQSLVKCAGLKKPEDSQFILVKHPLGYPVS
jgi:hypothetical protein